jgi:hypothetical protein
MQLFRPSGLHPQRLIYCSGISGRNNPNMANSPSWDDRLVCRDSLSPEIFHEPYVAEITPLSGIVDKIFIIDKRKQPEFVDASFGIYSPDIRLLYIGRYLLVKNSTSEKILDNRKGYLQLFWEISLVIWMP